MKLKLSAVCIAGAVLSAGGALAGGTIAGNVAFGGAAPKMEKLDRKVDAFCATTEVVDPTVTLSKDGKALANVVVRITKNAPTGAKAPAEPATVTQKGCMYTPRVQGAMEGQKLQVKNEDGTLHNVHGYNGAKTLFNQAQPQAAKPILKDTKSAEIVTLKCDVHPWMAAYIVMSKHPFFAVSGEDGAYQIKDVPPGAYTVEAWHEKLGTQTAEVTVEDGKVADAKLSFK